ncbi:MAG: alpha/beta hydrolase family protein [Lentimicrobium sp.]
MKPCFSGFMSSVIIFLVAVVSANAQERIPLNPGVYDQWKSIERPLISQNGQIVSYEINPQQGDGCLIINHPVTGKSDTIARAYEAAFSPSDDFSAYKVKPFYKDTRKAKLDGKKKDDLPKDSLGISAFNGYVFRFAGLKSFSLPAKTGNFLAALLETPKPEKAGDSATADSVNITENAVKAERDAKKANELKKKDKTETYTLKLIFPSDSLIYSWDSVSAFTISENGMSVAWTTYRNDSIPLSKVFIFETLVKKEREIYSESGFIRNLALDTAGTQLAYMHSSDTSDSKRYRLLYYSKRLSVVADTAAKEFPSGFCPGEHGKVYFSQDGTKLYFGIAPTRRPEPKDTLTDDEKARVDLWHWRDPLIQPQQLKQLETEKKRTYQAVFYPENNSLVMLGDENLKEVSTGFKGNGRYALGFDVNPYLIETSWKDAGYRDVYLVDLETGQRELLIKYHDGPVSLSTTQKYLSWYRKTDSLWYTMDLKTKKALKHTAGSGIAFFDEEHDVPSVPGPVGFAGWTQNDSRFVVYDRFDLWGLDPFGKENPENITSGEGRKTNTRFRVPSLNPDVPYIGQIDGFLLSSFNETTKEAGFYKTENGNPQPVLLEQGPYKFTNPVKARKSDQLLWTKGNFRHYPDLWTSSLDFSGQKKLSDANPQQKDYLWGNVELVKWFMPDGKEAEGLLYKPANFDSSMKYPMLVYFYERYSDQLHQHYVPRPSRSIISPTYCSSNGYLVFIPDISYRDGYPGQSAMDAVVSGTRAMASRGFVDTTRMGIQGQSWGGYQTAWMVTRTHLFKAAMAGAPVSNMTSAYGGIRWESGMVRQFQYEEGQSRIGATLWERPDLYIENSPLFRADKIETPLLIMSNDGDGAVPWYQGIELFTALRRLGKPVWLLNYNGDEHNLARRANMKDLDTRMMQFFDHYLKDAPAPEWMIKGIPAVEKGQRTGYEVLK